MTTMIDDNTTNQGEAGNSYCELRWNAAPPLDAAATNDDPEMNKSNKDPLTQEPHHQQQHQQHDDGFLPLFAEKTALLVVDVQPEYWSQCAPVRQDFPDFPTNLANTVETCRQRQVAKIIWVRADYRYAHSPWLKQFSRIHGLASSSTATTSPTSSSTSPHDDNDNSQNSPPTMGLQQQQQPSLPLFRAEVPCDPTSKDFTWEHFATPGHGDVIIPKSSWSSMSNTALLDILKASEVDTVLVCGLITSVCVQHSAFGIFEAGYRTILVTDACADRGLARHKAALALYGDYMYELITSVDLAGNENDDNDSPEEYCSPRALQQSKKKADDHDNNKAGSPILWSQHHKMLPLFLSSSTCSLLQMTPLSTSTSSSSLSFMMEDLTLQQPRLYQEQQQQQQNQTYSLSTTGGGAAAEDEVNHGYCP